MCLGFPWEITAFKRIIFKITEKDEITDDKVKRESGDSDGSDSDSDDDADVSKVCMISYKGLPG